MLEMTPAHKQLDRWLASQGKGSLSRIAAACGCSHAAVSHWVKRRTRPRDALRPIVRALTGIPEHDWRLKSEAKAIAAARVMRDVGAMAQP